MIADADKGRAEQHRQEQHLQDVALGQRPENGRGHDVHEEGNEALAARLRDVGGNRRGVQIGRVDVHAGPGPPQVDGDEAQDERDGGDDLEIDQRFDGDPPNASHVVHVGDAQHDRAEHNRRDEHADGLDEGVAERLHALASRGREVAEQHAGGHRPQDVNPQLPVPRPAKGCTE